MIGKFMPSTYLTLCNKVLQRLNEVELTEENFNDTRGIHSTVKTAVNDSINRINVYKSPWYFNSCEKTQILTIDQETYQWPSDFVYADWSSFQIQKDSDLNIQSKTLRKISKEEWHQNLKDRDVDSEPDGVRIPDFVFETNGFGFGVSPSPDKEYTLSYKYYKEPNELLNPLDVSTIPTRFDYIIVTGAMWYLNLFKGDSDATQITDQVFRNQIKEMYYQLSPQREYFYDTRVPSRRGPWEFYR